MFHRQKKKPELNLEVKIREDEKKRDLKESQIVGLFLEVLKNLTGCLHKFSFRKILPIFFFKLLIQSVKVEDSLYTAQLIFCSE